MRQFTAAAALSALAWVIAPSAAQAQSFPEKPVRILIASPVGGALGAFAQALGVEFQKRTGQPMVVEPKPGANQTVMMNDCKTAAPDGYTVCMTSRTAMSFNPVVYKNLQHDVEKDYDLISGLYYSNQVLIAKPALGKTLDEYVASSKANPNTVNYGSLGAGGDSHVIIEWIRKEKDADFTHIPYNGAAPSMAALASNEIQMLFLLMGNPTVMDQVKNGDLVALAVSGDERHPALPDTPTLVEVGLTPEIAAPRGWFGLIGPAGIPQDRIDTLSRVVAEILGDPEFNKQFLQPNYFDPAPWSPAEFRSLLDGDKEPARKMVEISGVTLD